MPFCPACGKENAAGATFCANCGKPLAATAAPPMGIGMPAAPAPAGMRYAEIIDRFVGMLIDYIIIFVISLIISIPLGLAALTGLGFFLAPLWIVVIFLWIVYFTYFEGTSGQTPGKSIAHTKVVDIRTGQTVDMGRAFLRSLLRIIDGIPFFLPYLIGLILIAVTPNRQRLGDTVANTVVVKV